MRLGQGEIYPLHGVIQHYSWGGYSYIPGLLQRPNHEGRPWAEYWLGAHPNHPSSYKANGEFSLAEAIASAPEAILGSSIASKFGELPYLFKVLDVRQMLSIQVHPDKASASKKFDDENMRGIPVHAPHRNYKDRNHKPEMMIALSEFWLLHGFKTEALLSETLSFTPELTFLKKTFANSDYKSLYELVMNMDQSEVNRILEPLAQRVTPAYKNDTIPKAHPDFWAARAVETFCKNDHYDRGIFSIYFFNLVHLKKGEGVFQPEGLPHAYLEGQNVELMANSDNVLRAGLTDKHIDVKELLEHLQFVAIEPRILEATDHEVWTFDTPAEEFRLTQYQLAPDKKVDLQSSSVEILLVVEGEVEISTGRQALVLTQGEAALITRDTTTNLRATARSLAFLAGSGLKALVY